MGKAWTKGLYAGFISLFLLLLGAGTALATPRRPSAVTGNATGVTGTSATIAGTVNPNGLATTYHFEYGTTTGYGLRTSEASAGSGSSPVSETASLSSLTAGAGYHYRIVGTNCGGCGRGTASGNDASFSTGGYRNPVFANDAPDPYVLDNGGTHNDYWEFNTGDLFPIHHSADLVHWSSAGTAFASRPSWVVQSGDWNPWSPSVVRTGTPCPGTTSTSCYVMYYTGLDPTYSPWDKCIGVATSTTPGGPYMDRGPLQLASGAVDQIGRPIGCGDDQGYSNIDPAPFVDSDGKAYLYVSTDFPCASGCQLKPTISVIALAPDLIHAASGRQPLFSGDASWEQASVPTVEGPDVERHNGTYYLLYSGGSWTGAYGMGYATSISPTGPFAKYAGNPVLTGTSTVFSPGGGGALVTGPNGGLWLVYHARSTSNSGDPRTLRIDPLSWQASATSGAPDIVAIAGPTSAPQSATP